jgi:hypothetical protein
MNDQAENDRIKTLARKSFNEAREITNKAKKAATLWAIALIIAWVSGIEPMWQNIVASGQAFTKINASMQEAERLAMVRFRALVREKQEIEELKDFEREYPLPHRDEESKRLARKLNRANERLERFKIKRRGEEKTEEEKMASSERDQALYKWRSFATSKAKLDSLSIVEREKRLPDEGHWLQEEKGRLRHSYAEAKNQAQAQERNVNFSLFGLDFKAPPLVAPLFWCIFCGALLAYLARARAHSVDHCAQGFSLLAQLPSPSEDELANLTGRLPTWVAVPSLLNNVTAPKVRKDETCLVQEPWMDRCFSSLIECQLLPTLLFFSLCLVWLVQVRVSWIELELSRYLRCSLGPRIAAYCIASYSRRVGVGFRKLVLR